MFAVPVTLTLLPGVTEKYSTVPAGRSIPVGAILLDLLLVSCTNEIRHPSDVATLIRFDNTVYSLSVTSSDADILGGLIGTVTLQKNGLATSSMAKSFGIKQNLASGSYIKFTQLENRYNHGYAEIVLFQTAGWSVDYPIKVIIAMTSDGGLQTAKAELICGDKTKIFLFKDSDNYLYIKHGFSYNTGVYISMKADNLLMNEVIVTPPELTGITIS